MLYKLGKYFNSNSVGGFVSIKEMVRDIQPSYVWMVALRHFHAMNPMYNLSPSTIIGMIYGVSCH